MKVKTSLGVDNFKNNLLKKLDWIEYLINNSMPHKGDKCSVSQKACVIQALNEFIRTINGIEINDFKEL